MNSSRKTARSSWSLAFMVIDIVLVVSCATAVYYLYVDSHEVSEHYKWAITVLALVVLITNSQFGVYRRILDDRFIHYVGRLVLALAVSTLLAASIVFLLHVGHRYSRVWLLSSIASFGVVEIVWRTAFTLVISRYYRLGRVRREIFLLGPSSTLSNIIQQMRIHRNEGYAVAGFQRLSAASMSMDAERLTEKIERSNASEVWLCMPLAAAGKIQPLMLALKDIPLDVRYFPELGELPLLNHRVSEHVGLYSIDISVGPLTESTRLAKRLEDILLGSLICLLISPILLCICVAIKLSSPGPILFKQYRTGINGKRFKVYKFRSMVVHREEDNNVTQASKDDRRVTRVGRFLRRTSLDELPQFYNVLQGRMSIVGPRPHALAHNDYYKELVESYMQRHKVKPGITGWAQVSGLRGETETVAKMQERVRYDLWYISNWSIYLDLKIIALTVIKGFINKNAY